MSRYFPPGFMKYRVTMRDAANTYAIHVQLPDGTVVDNLPVFQGQEQDLGYTYGGAVTLTLNDQSFGGATWDDSVTTHCHVTATDYGFQYAWDDLGGGTGPDGDFNDIIIDIFIDTTISTACSATVAVYKSDATTLISYLPRRRNLRWLDEMNSPGTAQLDLWLDDPILVEHANLLDEFNVVKIFLNGAAVKAWIIEDVQPTRVSGGGASDRWITVSGRGAISVLESAIVYPEYGLREFLTEDRYFNFASADGVWRDPAEWTTPVGALFTAAGVHHGRPTNWTDPAAYWLWSSNPSANAPVGINWFRSTFTVDNITPVVIQAAADNYFTIYIDGVAVLSSPANGIWTTRYTWSMTLARGEHTFAAVVTNAGTTPNPAGLLATIWRANSAGEATTTNVFRPTPANTLVKAYGAAPGWSGANILQQLIIEAQDRNVDSLLPITFDFDHSTDSAGLPWLDRQDRIVKVGTTDLADLATQVIELSLDLYLDPNFVLHAWRKRGFDLSNTVRIDPTTDATGAVGTIHSGKLRNQAILKYDGGWLELYSAVSKDSYGRREVGISLGTSGSTDQIVLAGTALMQEVAQPDRTIPVSYTCVNGPQPYRDFNLGDVIMVPDVYTGMAKARLMSIAGSEGEGTISWDLDFYPETNTDVIDSVVVATGQGFRDTSSLYQSEVLSDSPWAYWRLRETTGTSYGDQSGHARTALGVGTITRLQPGPVDKAVLFAPSGSPAPNYIHTNTKFAQGIVTLEVWVNVTTRPTTGRSTILGMAAGVNSTTHDKNLSIRSDGKVEFYTYSGGAHTLISPTALVSGRWYHVVGSVGGRGMLLYVNGVLVASAATIKTSYTAGQFVAMHQGGSGYSQGATYYMAEPAVYFQQLLDSRILNHWNTADYTP